MVRNFKRKKIINLYKSGSGQKRGFPTTLTWHVVEIPFYSHNPTNNFEIFLKKNYHIPILLINFDNKTTRIINNKYKK